MRKKTKNSVYCQSCRALLALDGTIKLKKGVPLATRHKQYCELFAKGLTQVQIAAELRLDLSYVSSIVKKCRELGWEVPTREQHKRRITVHGGGTAGIRGCKCDLCVEKSRQYKRAWKKDYEARRAAGAVTTISRVGHGGGTRGIRDCQCDLCVRRRRDYSKEWRADVKLNGHKRQRKKASVAQSG